MGTISSLLFLPKSKVFADLLKEAEQQKGKLIESLAWFSLYFSPFLTPRLGIVQLSYQFTSVWLQLLFCSARTVHTNTQLSLPTQLTRYCTYAPVSEGAS